MDTNPKTLARGLGWFSLALGGAELIAPRALCKALGLSNRPGLVRAYGLREIAVGIGLLTLRQRAPWAWARVAGDALDLGTLAAGVPRSKRPAALWTAIGSVAGVTALDVLCGIGLTKSSADASAAA